MDTAQDRRDQSTYSVQIQGHRGGYKPDNVIATFKKSLAANLEAIELDVWHTKDEVMVVVHGGDDGNLKDYGFPEEYIYEVNYERLLELDAGEGEKIPTLEQVFDLFKGKVFVNIELKGPRSPEFKPKYNCALAAEKVYDLVIKYNYHNRFLVSSFNSDILVEVERVRENNKDAYPHFDIIYLYNYENQPLPEPEVYTAFGNGINISANHITDEVVAKIKAKGMKIGVWVRAKDFKEDETFYENMFRYRVDFLCADHPLKAMEVRERFFRQQDTQ